ncbi:hypothetical protein EF902_33135 [Streptomyces sp. WAC05858]|nr:hypothetical protein EF902_33135 [Streptomyces sp. WAC05858]
MRPGFRDCLTIDRERPAQQPDRNNDTLHATLLPDVELAETETPPMLGLLSFRAPERVTVRRTARPPRPRALPA